MARVLGPLHSSEARGRVGGLIYNTWRGMAYVKNKIAPAQPRSAISLQQRAWGTMLTRAWANLEPGERDTWNAYASSHLDIDWTGNARRLTGANWFLRCNSRLLAVEVPPVVTAPVVAAPDAVTELTLTPGAGEIEVEWTTPAAEGLWVEIWLEGPRSAGRIPTLIRASRLTAVVSTVGEYTITPLSIGTYSVYVRALNFANGLVSPWVVAVDAVTEPAPPPPPEG